MSRMARRERLAPKRAKMSSRSPAKIDGGAFDRNNSETCGFEQGSNGRDAIIVNMFVNPDIRPESRTLQLSALLI